MILLRGEVPKVQDKYCGHRNVMNIDRRSEKDAVGLV